MVFGRPNKSPESEPAAPVGPLDRLGRRNGADGRADSAPADREAKLAAAAASLASTVAPRLRELIANDMPAGEVARQAGQQAQIHFRQNGVMLSPLELRGYVAEVLRPLLPATAFSSAAPPPAPAPAPISEPPPVSAVPEPELISTVDAVPPPA